MEHGQVIRGGVMRKILSLLLCLALIVVLLRTESAQAVVATCSLGASGTGNCYVDNTCTSYNGDGTTASCAVSSGGAGAFNSIANMLSRTYAADDHIWIKGSTTGQAYAESLAPNTSGTDGHPIIHESYGGKVVISGGSSSASIATKNYLKFKNLDFTTKNVAVSSGLGIEFENCAMRDSVYNHDGLKITGTSTVTVNNSKIYNNGGNGLLVGSGSTITLRNSLMFANGTGTSGAGNLNCASGATCDYDYNYITGAASAELNITGSGTKTDGGHNQLQKIPFFTSWPNGYAYFGLHIDLDNADMSFVSAFADGLTSGIPVTVFTVPGSIDASGVTTLSHLVDTHGWDIANHTWTHNYLATANMFTVATTNTGTNTLTIDTTGKTVSLSSTGNPENNCSTSFTTGGGYADTGTAADLDTACGTGKGWTFTWATVSLASVAQGKKIHLKTLASTTCTSFPCAAPFDNTATAYPYWTEEITESQQWFTDKLGTAPTIFAYPNASMNSTIESFVLNAGFTGSKKYLPEQNAMTLSSLNVFRYAARRFNLGKGTGSAADIRAMAHNDIVLGFAKGCIVNTLTHSASEGSYSEFNTYIDEMVKYGAVFHNDIDNITAIKADHSTSDSIIYTKSYTDSANLYPTLASPLIARGISVTGRTVDITGNPIIAGFETIGPYQYQPRPIMF